MNMTHTTVTDLGEGWTPEGWDLGLACGHRVEGVAHMTFHVGASMICVREHSTQATDAAKYAARAQAMLGSAITATPNPHADHAGIVVERDGITLGYAMMVDGAWRAELPDMEPVDFGDLLGPVLDYITHEHQFADGECQTCGAEDPQ